MDAGVIDGKRYFIPLFYSPDVFITTEETLNKYNLTSSEFSFKALSGKLSKNKKNILFLEVPMIILPFLFVFRSIYRF